MGFFSTLFWFPIHILKLDGYVFHWLAPDWYDWIFGGEPEKDDKTLCEECPDFLCQVEDGKDHWLPFLGPHSGLILVATGTLIVAGLAAWLLNDVFEGVEGTFRFGGDAFHFLFDFVKIPLWVLLKVTEFCSHYIVEGTTLLAETTHTYKELWMLVSFSAIVLALTEAFYEVSLAIWQQPEDSYFWWTFEGLNKPVKKLFDEWNGFFKSKWNPLRYAIYPLIGGAEILVVVLTPTLTLLNPLYWTDRYKKKPKPE